MKSFTKEELDTIFDENIKEIDEIINSLSRNKKDFYVVIHEILVIYSHYHENVNSQNEASSRATELIRDIVKKNTQKKINEVLTELDRVSFSCMLFKVRRRFSENKHSLIRY